MRKLILALALAVPSTGVAVAPIGAAVSTTQHLPAAACNHGTMNAHESVPETTGNGKMISAHDANPGTENVTPCGHGG